MLPKSPWHIQVNVLQEIPGSASAVVWQIPCLFNTHGQTAIEKLNSADAFMHGC